MNKQELHFIQDALSDRWTARYPMKYGSEIELASGAKIRRTAIRPPSRGTLQKPVLEELAKHLGVPWDELVVAAKAYAAATVQWGEQVLGEALAEWEAHWTSVGDMTPCVGTGVHSMRAPRYFLAPSKCFYDSSPYTVDSVRLFCKRWSDVIQAETLAAEACRRLGWSAIKSGEPCMWSVVDKLTGPVCFRVATLWDEMRIAFNRERHKQSWWDLWAKAPSAAEKVEVQRQAWDVLAPGGLNPFTPLVDLYRLGVGFGRDEFGDTYTRLSLLEETPA